MPLPISALGNQLISFKPIYIDTRWLLSYAAGISDHNPAYLNTTSPKIRPTNDFHIQGVQGSHIIAHPIFIWAVEWQFMCLRASELYTVKNKPLQLSPKEKQFGGPVHYGEDIIIHRPIQATDEITSSCTLIELSRRKQGTVTNYKFQHKDKNNQPVATTWNIAYWRGVNLDTSSSAMEYEMPPLLPTFNDSTTPIYEIEIAIAPYEGIIYTECSRIWNPIHSDPATAKASGLPGAILHGTATMAKCVTQIINRHVVGQDPNKVRRVVVGRFVGVVLMPSILTMRVLQIVSWKKNTTAIHYDLINEQGVAAIQGGVVIFDGVASLL